MNDRNNHSCDARSQTSQELLDELPLPYIEVDRNGYVTRANLATAKLHPVQSDSLIGHMAWELMATDEMAPSFAAYCALIESGDEPTVVRYNLFVRPGHFRTFEFHRALIRDGEGDPCGMRMFGVDVTESVKAIEETRTAALWLYSVVASLPLPVLVTDSIGMVRSVNPAAEAFFGWLPNFVTGRLLEQILPLAPYASLPTTSLNFNRALETPTRIQLTVLDAHGAPVPIEIATSPVSDAQTGNTSGIVCVLHKL